MPAEGAPLLFCGRKGQIVEGTIYCKALLTAIKAGDGGRPVYTFQASTETVDRQGEVVDQNGWELDNYLKNPVVLDSHQYQGIENIVGRCLAVRMGENGLEADIQFNDSPKGKLAQQLVDAGDLRAVSVGFIPKEMKIDPKGKEPLRHCKQELLEISTVAVPAQADSVRLRGFNPNSPNKATIPPHTTPKAPEDAPWDAGSVMRECEGPAQLRKVCAWVDSDGDPAAKQSYKLPHHMATGEAVWRGVAAAMAALMGGRGGVDIPDGDRRGVYNHLARHYAQFEKEPPEFKTAEEIAAFGPEEIKGLFWEGEMDEEPVQKAGRRLSNKSRRSIQQAIDILTDLLAEEQAADQEEGSQEPKAIEIDVDLGPLEALVRKEA